MNQCRCGRRISRNATECSKCHTARLAEIHATNITIVKTGKCPKCGAPLRRNWSLTGWYQCSQYGAEGFRADASKPQCGFQCFTE